MTMQWARPEALLLLLPLAVLAWWVWRARGTAIPLPRAGQLRSGGSAARLACLPGLFRWLTLLLLVLAIAGPRTAGAVVEEQSEGVPIVLAVDVSSSMLARDLGGEDRLTVARRAMGRFIEDRPNDPVGVVAFAGESLTLVPVTMHRRVLQGALDQLAIGLLEDGTAIGEGLATALARLRRVEAASRVVVLMSDGANNRGEIEPLDAARAAAALGVQVHTIGVGSRRPVEARAPTDAATEEAAGALDEALLRQIATLTGGQYFRADEAGSLERIYGEIDQLVTSPIQTRRRLQFRSWHLPLLLAASVFLAAEWLLRGSRWGAIP